MRLDLYSHQNYVHIDDNDLYITVFSKTMCILLMYMYVHLFKLSVYSNGFSDIFIIQKALCNI